MRSNFLSLRDDISDDGYSSATSQDIFVRSIVCRKNRSTALSKIYRRYKTIVVTDSETKCSKVITFKGSQAPLIRTTSDLGATEPEPLATIATSQESHIDDQLNGKNKANIQTTVKATLDKSDDQGSESVYKTANF